MGKVTKAATKAVVGASLELIKQKRTQKPEVRAAAREAALREIKIRAQAKQAEKKRTLRRRRRRRSRPCPRAASSRRRRTSPRVSSDEHCVLTCVLAREVVAERQGAAVV